MRRDPSILIYYLYVAAAAIFVFVVAHWDALMSPYVINDDVRQQIYWMQSWLDPELYQNDLLTEYAKNYVPWGVRAVYAATATLVEPLYFSKILTGILFVATACLMFALGLGFGDRLTAVLIVCVYFLYGAFLSQMSGGLSRGFVYPLLAAHLLVLDRGMIVAASAVIVLESILNPYVFLVSLSTQALFVAHHYGRSILTGLFSQVSRFRTAFHCSTSEADARPSWEARSRLNSLSLLEKIGIKVDKKRNGYDPGEAIPTLSLLVSCALVTVASALIALKYGILKSPEFGSVVTRAQMGGGIEYTASGRYDILPGPFWLELIRSLTPWPETSQLSILVGCVLFCAMVLAAAWSFTRKRPVVNPKRLRIFVYLLCASLLLYFAADLLFMKLFVPRRYLEFSVSLLYCVLIAMIARTAIEEFGMRRFAFPALVTLLVLIGAARLHGIALYDYSRDAGLYELLKRTPKSAVVAGHPEVMDNIPTFARRTAFVTYELSHSWYDRYWDVIKKRTFDFFTAYYSSDPEQIRHFGRDNGISYMVVREADFAPENLSGKAIYFEPFGDYVRKLTAGRHYFAILDVAKFPPVFQSKGMRVVKLN